MKKLFGLVLALAFAVNAYAGPIITRNYNLSSTTPAAVENLNGTGINFHVIRWNNPGTATTCTVQVQKSPNGINQWTDLIAATSCTSSGTATITTGVANYIRVSLATYGGSGTVNVFYGGYIDVAAGISSGVGTSGRVAFFDSPSTLAGDADLTFSGDTLTATKIIASTSINLSSLTSGRVLIASTSGLVLDDAGLVYDANTDALTTGIVNVISNGAASVSPSYLYGTWFSGGSATTTKPYLLIEPSGTTSTGWSTSGTGLGVNAASGFSGNLLDLQVAGASRFSILASGNTGIGVIAGTAPLEVRGTGAVIGTITASERTGNNYAGLLLDGSNRGGIIYFAINGTPLGNISGLASGDITINPSGGGIVSVSSNLGVGTSTFGTNATSTLALFNGTAPTTSPADTVQLFSTDISAGNASLGIRTETAVASDVAVASTHSLSVTINGTIYKILLATP